MVEYFIHLFKARPHKHIRAAAVGVLSRSYHPAGRTGAFSGHMMACSSILTRTPLHALGAMFARRTWFLAAEGTTQRWHDRRHFIDESETTFRRRRDSSCTSHFKPIIIRLMCFCYVRQKHIK